MTTHRTPHTHIILHTCQLLQLARQAFGMLCGFGICFPSGGQIPLQMRAAIHQCLVLALYALQLSVEISPRLLGICSVQRGANIQYVRILTVVRCAQFLCTIAQRRRGEHTLLCLFDDTHELFVATAELSAEGTRLLQLTHQPHAHTYAYNQPYPLWQYAFVILLSPLPYVCVLSRLLSDMPLDLLLPPLSLAFGQ